MISRGAGGDASASIGAERKRLAMIGAVAELRHPHLIVMRAGDGGGFEPELAGGRLLSELQQSEGPLPLRVMLRILLDVMSGLAALHHARAAGNAHDFVHGEVMPANIVVGCDGLTRLVPLVKAHWSTSSPAAREATGYTAPEKLLGDAFGQRADVFSAGVLLWEAMMRRSLFRDASVDQVVTQLVGGKVARPEVAVDAPWSAELADVVMRALSVDPADRWEHVGMMGADIETIAEGEVARLSEVAALVTGRDVSRDSLSEAVTRPHWSQPSLSPLVNSIPASPDEPAAPDSRGALRARADSTEPPASAATRAARVPRTKRRRWAVAGWALALCALVLVIAALKKLERKTASTITATPLAPAAAAPAAAPLAERAGALLSEAPPVASSGEVKLVRPRVAAQGAASSRSAASTSSSDHAKASAPPGKARAKDDPFGLMKPVRPNPKDDPFGL